MIPNLCYLLVRVERLKYISELNEVDMLHGTLLETRHQSIFRYFYEQQPENIYSFLEEYFMNLSFRKAHFYQIKQKIIDEINEISKKNSQIPNLSLSHKDWNLRATHLFSDSMKKYNCDNHVWYANSLGFGCFFSCHDVQLLEYSFKIIKDTNCASSMALMNLGFNIPSQKLFFLQEKSIITVAFILYLHCKYSFPPSLKTQWWEKKVSKEISFLPEQLKQFNSIFDLTKQFLIYHELGHSFQIHKNRHLLDFFNSIGILETELYKPESQTEYDFLSWQRIKEGGGNVRDVTFILGDLLANVAVTLSNVDSYTLTTLKAFNWWLISPINTKKIRPRGNISFLRYSTYKDWPNFFSRLTDILLSSMKQPEKVLDLIYDMERDSWQKLKSDFS